ncbi:hypothetical protein BCR41DRAFT_159887 [Lobosporangium transversale]|uniref:Crinkler effector protein N-terminal domain-containing protein n=1 Tax=Lobosporangium transversale TaxID=64571 RepID=A0A1Y2GD55_9FUNG|nr:hypothetical protein BCR41DRAFT_159887 [Lobosporangium transversale]ORZ07520.1 hypothetical protein BCR41DRAFT_159887 [Lobosporangium transversale]|eukprot:XP_021878027.1 hypothetical protein BCR41DRAFT_159887 [Lobosporangium transversale]
MGSGTTTPNGPSRRGSIERKREVEKEPTNLRIYCIVAREATSFPVNIPSDRSVGELKQAIKAAKKPELDHVAADKLTLWRTVNPRRDKDNKVDLNGTVEKTELDDERALLSELDELTSRRTYVIVKLPPPDIGTDSQEKNGRRSTVYFTFKEDTH